MERVAFIVEETGERITCMLNPEHIVQRRIAGLAPRRTGAGIVAGPARSDSPLLHTGGGRTELELQLLFDVDLVPAPIVPPPPPPVPTSGQSGAERADRMRAGSSSRRAPAPPPPPRRDVRDHTRPLWQLAENSARRRPGRAARAVRPRQGDGTCSPSSRRSPSGSSGSMRAARPSRSWLSMRLVRVPDPNPPAPETPAPVTIPDAAAAAAAAAAPAAIHPVVGAGPVASRASQPTGGETLPEIAARYFDGRSALWRWIADVNLLDDVIWPEPGRDLIIPPAPEDLPTGGAP